jgi:type VI secretion system protein ImpC
MSRGPLKKQLRTLGGSQMTTSSSQKFIARNRAPRVQIEYDVEIYGAEKRIMLPFIVGVLADLAGQPSEPLPRVFDRRMLEIDIDNFDERLLAINPRVAFSVPNHIGDSELLDVDITFDSLDDFSPGAVVRKVVGLDSLLEQRTLLSNLLTYMDGKVAAEQTIELLLNDRTLLERISSQVHINSLDRHKHSRDIELEPVYQCADSELEPIIQEFYPKSDAARYHLKRALLTLAKLALSDYGALSKDVTETIKDIIKRLDQQLTAQLNPILHHSDFQQLEGAWRGLHYLVSNTETDEMLKIRFMSLTKRELYKSVIKYSGSTWNQGPLFKKIYEDEYGQFGGEPYGCLIGDYEFGYGPNDIAILSQLARIAAASHSPLITAASASVMHMDSWQEVANPQDLSKLFVTAEYASWRSLRESEDSKYLALVMPRFLARLPYEDEVNPVEEFAFKEECRDGDIESYTWCNSAYAMGVNITRAFSLYGWCARIRGMESGGNVDGLPAHIFPTDDGGIDMMSPTEISISDRREVELTGNGFIPLLHRKNSDIAVFISAQSFHKAAEYDDPDMTANSALAARLPIILACCRFAHYLRCIVRDRQGSFMDRTGMESWLNEWIQHYVEPDPATSSEESKARRPLADAEIVLDDIEGDPGYYLCKLYIRPHYQLEALTISNRLLLRLPSSVV